MQITPEHLVPGSYQRSGFRSGIPRTRRSRLSTQRCLASASRPWCYGDISPVRSVAGFLCVVEAVVGQLHVGGMVGLRINAKATC